MAKFNQDTPQFGSVKPGSGSGSAHCTQCEAMLADMLDGTLSPGEQALFDLHLAGCTACQQMLADAQRGAAWLDLLRTSPPHPPLNLVDRILAQTSAQTTLPSRSSADEAKVPSAITMAPPQNSAAMAAPILPVPGKLLPFPRRVVTALRLKPIGMALVQPRLAMTAAMAFFSIGLTLNLTGVQLNQLRASDLKPSSVRRDFYQANAHVVRYVENLRAVYELESRVRDLQRASDSKGTGTSEPAHKAPADPSKDGKPNGKQPRAHTGSGTSRRQDLALPESFTIRAGVPEGIGLRPGILSTPWQKGEQA